MRFILFFSGVFTVILLSSPISRPTCNDCISNSVQINSSTNECRFIFDTTSANCSTHHWRGSGYSSEDYFMCWIFSDGSFKTVQYNNPNPNPVTHISSGNPPSGAKVAFATACNRYGDDDDKLRVWGIYSSYMNPQTLSYSSAPAFQTLPGSGPMQINTSHGTDYTANCNQLLLIISITGDSADGTLPSGSMRLNLYSQSKGGSPIAYYKNNGTIPTGTNPHPSGNNSYFEFADPLTTPAAQTISGLSPVASWTVLNFSGKVKNVYCLLSVPDVDATDANPVADTFTAKLTDLNQTTTYKFTTKKITIKSAYDPNMISVNKDTSRICGKSPEELEYTIRFQNTGTGEANKVGINLDLDPALDKNSLRVVEVGVGHNVYTTSSSATMPVLASSAGFTFNYSTANQSAVFPVSASQNPTVNPDAAFLFSGHQFLAGSLATDEEDSKGYLKFTIKTAAIYSSLHNRAGIFFDDEDEVATNLAETICIDPRVVGSDSCASELTKCNKELEECNQNCNGWLHWFPWIIAGLEFLILIYLLTRRKK